MKKGLRLCSVSGGTRIVFASSEKVRPNEEGTARLTMNDGQRTMNKRRRNVFLDFKVQGAWFIVHGNWMA